MGDVDFTTVNFKKKNPAITKIKFLQLVETVSNMKLEIDELKERIEIIDNVKEKVEYIYKDISIDSFARPTVKQGD